MILAFFETLSPTFFYVIIGLIVAVVAMILLHKFADVDWEFILAPLGLAILYIIITLFK